MSGPVDLWPGLRTFQILRLSSARFKLIRREDDASVILQGTDANHFQHELEAASIVGMSAAVNLCSRYNSLMIKDVE